MKPTVPILAPLLRSNAQGDILGLLLMNSDKEFSLTDIVRYTRAQPATVHREIQRLVDSGLFQDRRVGRTRLIRVNTGHEWHRSLEELLRAGYGPRAVLEPLVAQLPGVSDAYIYGSWAARYAGESGEPPRDIDVLIVGSTPRLTLAELGRTAQEKLRREVNVTRVSRTEWDAAETPFVKTLKSRPLLPLQRDVVGA